MRLMFSRFGSVPPTAASLREAAIWIKAFKASRRRAVLSVIPVYSYALRSNSSSSATVALMETSYHQE
jgi:hypothetical protein